LERRFAPIPAPVALVAAVQRARAGFGDKAGFMVGKLRQQAGLRQIHTGGASRTAPRYARCRAHPCAATVPSAQLAADGVDVGLHTSVVTVMRSLLDSRLIAAGGTGAAAAVVAAGAAAAAWPMRPDLVSASRASGKHRWLR